MRRQEAVLALLVLATAVAVLALPRCRCFCCFTVTKAAAAFPRTSSFLHNPPHSRWRESERRRRATSTDKLLLVGAASSSSSPSSQQSSLAATAGTDGEPTTTAPPPAAAAPSAAGAKALEEWLLSPPKPARIALDSIEHASFGGGVGGANAPLLPQLRGLRWKDQVPPPSKPTVVAVIPSSKAISTTASNDDGNVAWDADLAAKLWDECAKGETSRYRGYVEFLLASSSSSSSPLSLSDDCPAPLAPNAIRHWTAEQRKALEGSDAGKRLLMLDEKQQSIWKQKYDDLVRSKRAGGEAAAADVMSYSQFRWAMEAVHSRAFRGLMSSPGFGGVTGDGGGTTALLLALAAPIGAAAAGVGYYLANPSPTGEPSLAILSALGAIAALPLVLNLPSSGGENSGSGNSSPTVTSLLPFIDSANHRAEADSIIEYNPISRCYELSIGPKCIDRKTRQLFVSYGSKSDEELLLNYGFLPSAEADFSSDEDGGNTTLPSLLDRQRRALAREFHRRNS